MPGWLIGGKLKKHKADYCEGYDKKRLKAFSKEDYAWLEAFLDLESMGVAPKNNPELAEAIGASPERKRVAFRAAYRRRNDTWNLALRKEPPPDQECDEDVMDNKEEAFLQRVSTHSAQPQDARDPLSILLSVDYALSALTEDLQQVYELIYVEGLTPGRAAKQMGISRAELTTLIDELHNQMAELVEEGEE